MLSTVLEFNYGKPCGYIILFPTKFQKVQEKDDDIDSSVVKKTPTASSADIVTIHSPLGIPSRSTGISNRTIRRSNLMPFWSTVLNVKINGLLPISKGQLE